MAGKPRAQCRVFNTQEIVECYKVAGSIRRIAVWFQTGDHVIKNHLRKAGVHVPDQSALAHKMRKIVKIGPKVEQLNLDDLRTNYGAFALAMHPDWGYTHFQQAILAPRLEATAACNPACRRQIIEMPFRHSKTQFCVETFLPFYFGHNPEHAVILLGYGKALARASGRTIRELMKTDLYQTLFPSAGLAKFSRAQDEFQTVSGGKFYAGGFDTGVNGRGAHLLCVAQGAHVVTRRGHVPIEQVTVHDEVATPWAWQRVTRVFDNGTRPVVRIGYGKHLLTVTHDHHILTPTGWREAGTLRKGDRVYGASLQAMQEGVRAQGQAQARYQAREQVLLTPVQQGMDVRALRREAASVQTVRQDGRCTQAGEALLFPSVLLGVGTSDGWFAHTETDYLRDVHQGVSANEPHNTVLFDDLQGSSTRDVDGGPEQPELPYWQIPDVLPAALQEAAIAAATVAVPRMFRVYDDTQFGRSPFGREQEERYDREHCGPLPTVSHEISQVEECGLARVYDLQVEGDHCFIADGIYVHNCIDDPHKSRQEMTSETIMSQKREMYNSVVRVRLEPSAAIMIASTRWAPSDLIGWRIGEEGAYDVIQDRPYVDGSASVDSGAKRGVWDVIRLRAVATEDEGWRHVGEPLWPERWPMSELEPIKQADITVWESSFQQEPTVSGGYWFAGTPLNFYEETNARDLNVYMVCDPALRKTKKADFTVILVFGVGGDNNYYWLDCTRARLDPAERADHIFRLHRKWRPISVGYEEYGLQSDIVTLKDRMERENYRFPIIELGRSGEWHNLSKSDRVRALMPLAKLGRIWLPNPETHGRDTVVVEDVKRFINEEWQRYPACKYDDVVDAMSRLCDPAMKVAFPTPVRDYTPMPRRRGSWMTA